MGRRTPTRDEGMTLVETVVAMVVFAVFAAAAASYLLNTLGVERGNTQRVTAANLAAQQIELVRGVATLSLVDGTSDLVQPQLGGTTYTLHQTVHFVASAAGESVCNGTSTRLAYKLVTVTVTWPGMGSVKPVRSDTLKSLGLGVGQADVRKGTVAVGVTDGAGAPRSGTTVAISPSGLSTTTDTDGCAVFPNLDPAVTYTATLTAPGSVGRQGEATVTSPFTVLAGKVVRLPLGYAPRGALSVATTAPAGYSPPSTLAVSVDSSVLLTPSPRALPDCAGVAVAPQNCVTGTPRTDSALFPAVYTAWAGTCTDARPSAPQSVAVASGATTAVTSSLGALQLKLSSTTQTSLAGATLYAVHAPGGSCPTGESYPLTVVSPSERGLALPPGTWSVSKNPDGTSPLLAGSLVTAGAVKTVTA